MGFGIVNVETTFDTINTNQTEYSTQISEQTTAVDNRAYTNITTFAPTYVSDSPYASVAPSTPTTWSQSLDVKPATQQLAEQGQEATAAIGKSDWLMWVAILAGIGIVGYVAFKKV